jgi:hypothetical protein
MPPPTTTSTITVATTTAAPTTSSSAGTPPSMPPGTTSETLAGFVGAVMQLHDGAQSLIAEAALVPAGGPLTPAVAQQATGAVEQFFALSALISSGLHPDVREAAVDVVFAVGREVAPFLFAPGWESDGWDVWASGVEDARIALPETLARLADAATLHPDAGPEDRNGVDDAAFHGGLAVLLVRAFGHANFNTQPPWSVRWTGGLPSGAVAPTCFDNGIPSTTGTFVDQDGGCAILYYDTADPATHDAELAAWIAHPASFPTFKGEVITVRWTNGQWIGIGSAE